MSSQSVRSCSSPEALPVSRVSLENIASPEELQYTLGKTLGSGTYAKVRAAWNQRENKMIAIKIIEKDGATREFLEKFLPREMHALRRLRHRNILRLHRLVETPRQVYFMLEMAHNGDLLDYINTSRRLPEPQARFVMQGISAGIEHCHSKGIVHRDLKCENIMLTKDMDVKIGDFGFAREVDDRGTGVSTPCGSFSYAAPELFSDRLGLKYDAKKADVWSMGCILYAMVCGRLPFGDDTQVARNLAKPLNFPLPLTEDCKNIVQLSMLTTDVEARCSVARLRLCHWMRGPTSSLTPYRNVVYTEENCLPRFLSQSPPSPSTAKGSPYAPSPCEATAPRRRSHQQLLHVQTQTPSANTGQSTAASSTMTTPTVAAINPPCKEVHRRKRTAVERLEQRLRVLKDPAILHSVTPSPQQAARSPAPGMKARISSAGKKVFQTFLHHSSPRPPLD